MSIHARIAGLIEEDGATVLTLAPLLPELTPKQLTNGLTQAKLSGLIHPERYEYIPGTRCAKVAIYKPGPDPKAITKSRPVSSVWDLA